MRKSLKIAAIAAGALGLVATGAIAQQVMHNQQGMEKAPFASSVMVPAGYDTYYISGAAGKGANTEEQAAATLEQLKGQLAKLGLTMGDVVQAHVFLAPDPATGKMDFAGMNKSWFKYFGTPDQPNKPARAAFQVGALAGPTMVEIEFIAAKKGH